MSVVRHLAQGIGRKDDEQHIDSISKVLEVALIEFSKILSRSGKRDTDHCTEKPWCSRHQS